MDITERVITRAMDSGVDPDLAAEVAAMVYAVTRLITCPWPKCGRILDARRAVVVEARDVPRKAGERPARSVLCASCFDTLTARLGPVAAPKVIAVVVDGREHGALLA
jgi:hypothetical protein